MLFYDFYYEGLHAAKGHRLDLSGARTHSLYMKPTLCQLSCWATLLLYLRRHSFGHKPLFMTIAS